MSNFSIRVDSEEPDVNLLEKALVLLHAIENKESVARTAKKTFIVALTYIAVISFVKSTYHFKIMPLAAF